MGENKSKTLGQSEGVKFDEGKDPWELLPWDAVERVVQVLKFGMVKYKARNWENGISYSRQFAATIRHLVKWYQYRQEDDHESSINHLAHAICDLLFILAYVIRQTKGKDGLELDDRPDTYKAVEVPYSTGLRPCEVGDGYTGEEEYLDELDDSADDSYAKDYVDYCVSGDMSFGKTLLQTLEDASKELGLTPYADDSMWDELAGLVEEEDDN